MTEPDVTLTDFALALGCGVFAFLLFGSGGEITRLFAFLFAALACASLLGGLYHGFFTGVQTGLGGGLWLATLLVVGLVAVLMWQIGASMLLDESWARLVRIGAGLQFAVYAALILFKTRSFLLASANSLPASVFLLVAYAWLYAETGDRAVLTGLIGLGLVFVGAGLQFKKVGLHPTYFTHNALYHVVQGVAFLLVFLSVAGVERLIG